VPARVPARAPVGVPTGPCDGLTRAAARALGTPAALLTFVDAGHQGLASHVGPLPGPWASARGTPGSHPFCRHVVTSGRPLVVRDARAHASRPDGPDAGDAGAVAYAGVPLLAADGRAIGCLCAVQDAPRDWTADDVAVLSDLAAAAVACLELHTELHTELRAARLACAHAEAELRAAEERSRLGARANGDFTEDARRRLRAERLQALSAALSIAATPDAVAAAVVGHAAAAFEAAGAVVACVMPDGRQVEIMRVGDMPDDVRDDWRRFPLDAPVPLADATRAGEPIFLESREAWGARYPDLVPLLHATGHHANAVAPLVVNGRALGVLGIAFTSPRPFDEEDRAAVLTVAQQCALALERARLYEAEQMARAEAEAANRAKGEFLAAMSHELRTPLNAIAGHVQLLAMELHGPVTDAQRGAFGRIEAAQRHLLRLVNDVLNFARLQAGRLEYDVRAVPVAEVVAELEPMIGPQLAAKALAYTVDVPAGCVVRADRDKLVQILLNLLSNAVKFTPAGGRVALECVHRADGSADGAAVGLGDGPADAAEAGGAEPAAVFLRVTDTGVGIPREKQGLVFEPFVQVDTTLAGRAAGAGLGLAISRDLARGMGGDLRVRSAVGVGTTFTVALPVA
jgi:signal transduction histidine kinase